MFHYYRISYSNVNQGQFFDQRWTLAILHLDLKNTTIKET